MTYQSDEESVASGLPVKLVWLHDDVGDDWRYTTYHETVTYNGYDWEPEVVDVGRIKLSERPVSDALKLKLGKNNLFAKTFVAGPIESPVEMTVYRGHPPNFVTRWFGYLTSVEFDEEGMPVAQCEPRTSSMLRMGRRRRCQKLCDHALYSEFPGCTLLKNLWKVTGTVVSVSGLNVVATVFGTKTNGWFKAGELVIGNEKRLITAHVGNTVTVSRALRAAEANDPLTAYAGCDHLPTTCHVKFNNKYNYGGSEFLPIINPSEVNIEYATG